MNDTNLRAALVSSGMTPKEVFNEMLDAKILLQQYLEEDDQDAAYNICEELWGLEPDYVEDLI